MNRRTIKIIVPFRRPSVACVSVIAFFMFDFLLCFCRVDGLVQEVLPNVFGNASQFQKGLYIYRVSSVFGPDDANNPNGESLAGDPLNVNMPSVDGFGFFVTLTWTAVPNAVGYKVYRTSGSGQSFSDTQLLATTVTNTFFDDGSAGLIGTGTPQYPLPEGSLGAWKNMTNNLALTPRMGHIMQAEELVDGNTVVCYGI